MSKEEEKENVAPQLERPRSSKATKEVIPATRVVKEKNKKNNPDKNRKKTTKKVKKRRRMSMNK